MNLLKDSPFRCSFSFSRGSINTDTMHTYVLLSASSWLTGEWSECSRSCNGGLRTREVLCKRRISGTEEKILDDSACTPPRPSLTEPCSNHSCPPEWLALDWSEVGRCFWPCMWSTCTAVLFFSQLMAEIEPILQFSAEFLSD